MEKLIRKRDAIRELAEYLMTDAQIEWSGTASEDIEDWKELAEQILNNIPTIEPWDLYDAYEWCRDCKEYDIEHHNCPRWNRVIRKTLEENQPKHGEWIPCDKNGLALTELMRREGRKWYGYRCSNCNFIYKGNALTECDFCQKCGALMKGADNEHDK